MNRSNPIRVAVVMGKMMGGGVEATVMNYYRHLDHSCVQFDFVVDDNSTVVPEEEIKSLGGRVFVVPKYKNLPAYIRGCKELFTRIKPDIVHSQMNVLSVFPLYAAKHAGISVRIAHSHSTSNPQEHVRDLAKRVLKPFAKIYPTAYAACSRHAATWLFGKKFVDSGNVYIMKNALQVEDFVFNSEIRQQKRAELGVDDSQLVIGQVGRMSSQKNQMFGIDVFAQILKKRPNAVMMFAGDGEIMDEVQAHANELGVADSVRFLGVRDDIADLYKAFDVLAFPSLYEGFGMAAVEAQAADLPVAASTEVPDEAVIIKELIRRIPLSTSIQEWADLLIRLAEDKLTSGRASRQEEITEAGYEITSSAEGLTAWYTSLVDDRMEK
ncbi:glycosyltransferase family 1 protein [Bifidobacterium angulatum]|uniref:glycosyltransferase family 1 protein n=1 Tax=Bifidobacterium angulatum TaxID=1683 RepID=UPI00406C5D5B